MLKQLLILLSLISLSLQGDYQPTHTQLCAQSCQDAFEQVTFGSTVSTDDYYTGWCQDTYRWSSTWLCAKSYCSPHEIQIGSVYFQKSCDIVHLKAPTYESVIANFTDEMIQNLTVVGYDDVVTNTPKEIYNTTLLATEDLFHQTYISWEKWIKVMKGSYDYSMAMYGFWAITILIGMLNRLFMFGVHYRQSRVYQDPEAINARRSASKSLWSTPRRWIRTNVTLPATFGYRHQQAFGWCTVPTRITSFLVFSFVAINIVLCSVGYSAFKRNVFWPTTTSEQIWTYMTDRTGIIAVANLPILWLFAGRNNVFLWLTGWDFATFNSFHRWVSRVVTVQVIIHSIGYTYIYLRDGGRAQLAEAYKEQFWYCGVMATISFSFLLLFSMYPIRQKAYEFFVLSHIALAIIGLVGTYYHVLIYDDEFTQFLWPCVAFWVFDRVVRLARIAVLNYKVVFFRHTKLLATYNPDRDIIRITACPSYHRQPRPGAYYFLYFPTMLRALGNHPFTMATWSAGEKGTLPNPILDSPRSVSQEKEVLSPTVIAAEKETSSQSSHSSNGANPSTQLHFIIRPYGGLTASLRDKILKTGGLSLELTALVEGPYGETHPILKYSTVVFIAGGSGIAAVLPYMQQFLLGPSSQTTKRVHVIWAARQQTFVREVLDHELAPAAVHPAVKLDLYVTGNSPKPVKDMTVALDRFDEDIGMRYARPAIPDLLPKEVRESAGSVAVLVCGPSQMADDTRKAAVAAIGEGHEGLGYYEEYFGW